MFIFITKGNLQLFKNKQTDSRENKSGFEVSEWMFIMRWTSYKTLKKSNERNPVKTETRCHEAKQQEAEALLEPAEQKTCLNFFS